MTWSSELMEWQQEHWTPGDAENNAYVHGYACGLCDPPRDLESIWVDSLRPWWKMGYDDARGKDA